jgi:hypothetical protein
MCVTDGDAIPVRSINVDVVVPYDRVAKGRPASAFERREEQLPKIFFVLNSLC